ncbi:hypothetical protein RvY_08297 [Ramazzottius varieornatus]|uniref:Uncharacterized protein n=1 Tax=Ramazzottius varieornatus TaxID=947166 RepID=A0A1D1V7P5_RAMVA|nr:hypothetical protein RvY_08297 [Ramazzottius varieornatus]
MPSAGVTTEDGSVRKTSGVDPKTPPSETSSSLPSRKSSVASIPNIPSTADLPVLPHHELDDSDFISWLRKNSDAEMDTFASEHHDKHVQKKYQQYLHQLEKLPHSHLEMSRSHCDGVTGSNSPRKEKDKERSEAKRILHALHLDRKDRDQKKKEQAKLKEELEDKLWKEELRKEHEARLARSNAKGGIPSSFTHEPDIMEEKDS